MPESLEEIATCALYEPTAQREAVLAREIIALRELVCAEGGVLMRLNALEAAGARGGTRRSYPPTQRGWDQAMADMGALQQQLAESRAALAKYGAHHARCFITIDDITSKRTCTCGLATALAATTPTESGS